MSAGAGGTQRRAEDAEGLRGAWGAVEGSWRQATDRASALPDGAVDVSVEGEWCCPRCRRGKNREVRQAFARKLRRRQRVQLLTLGDIDDVDMSIGYTD